MNIPQRARELALDLRQEWTSTKDIAAIEAFAAEIERDALERALNTRLILMGDWNEHDEEIFLCGVEERDRGIRALIAAPTPERPETDDDTDTLINVVRQASRLIAMVDGILTGNRDTQMDELRSAIVSVSDKLHERYAGTLRPDPTENDPTVALAKFFAEWWGTGSGAMPGPGEVVAATGTLELVVWAPDHALTLTALGHEALRIAKENDHG